MRDALASEIRIVKYKSYQQTCSFAKADVSSLRYAYGKRQIVCTGLLSCLDLRGQWAPIFHDVSQDFYIFTANMLYLFYSIPLRSKMFEHRHRSSFPWASGHPQVASSVDANHPPGAMLKYFQYTDPQRYEASDRRTTWNRLEQNIQLLRR